MKKLNKRQTAKIIIICATVLVAILFVIILVQNFQIKALEQQLHDIAGQLIA